MYRFSLREMLALLVLVSVTLTFTQFHFTIAAGALVATIFLSGIFLNATNWRCLAYGSVLGILGGILAIWAYASLATGVVVARNYQESNALGEITETLRPYLFPLGALIGATTALLKFGKREEQKPESLNRSEETANFTERAEESRE